MSSARTRLVGRVSAVGVGLRAQAQRLVPTLLLAAPALLPVTSCGGTTAVETQHELGSQAGGPLGSAPLRLDAADPLEVRHTGRRLVRVADPSLAEAGGLVQFYEAVASDGAGAFSVLADESFAPNLPPGGGAWPLFQATQFIRQGYLVRFRGFRVLDPSAMAEEWSVFAPGASTVVAGRSARQVVVTHLRSGRRFELALDIESNLILDQREYAADGELVLQIVYESVDLDPDLGAVAWFQPATIDPLTLDEDFEATLGFDLRVPTNPPPGYSLLSIAVVHSEERGDPSGPWVRVLFSNGVDPLFYMLNVASARAAGGGAKPAVGPGSTGAVLASYPLGRATALVGDLPHGRVMAAGRVSTEELVDLVHSGLPE